MHRDVQGVAVVSVMFAVFAVFMSGSALGVLTVCVLVAGAILLFRER